MPLESKPPLLGTQVTVTTSAPTKLYEVHYKAEVDISILVWTDSPMAALAYAESYKMGEVGPLLEPKELKVVSTK
jgi:hypothetical protein